MHGFLRCSIRFALREFFLAFALFAALETHGQFLPLDNVKALTAGARHSCAVADTGGMMCWGYNYVGQLGDGSTTDRNLPVPVSGLVSGVKLAAAGVLHTCVLFETGGVACWGINSAGELGDGSMIDRRTPAPVSGLASGVKSISAGAFHTCALLESGAVMCWGANLDGELGDGSTIDRAAPVPVLGLASGVSALAAGERHTCAVLDTGSVWCWGANDHGELGDGSTIGRLAPVPVVGLAAGAQTLAVGAGHSCALLDSGAAMCWGNNRNGQLGSGVVDTADMPTPVTVSGLAGKVQAMAAGWGHTCALLDSGELACWGNNRHGQLGDLSLTDQALPVPVAGLNSRVKALALGDSHSCALLEAGNVSCWGENGSGQLGDGTSYYSFSPIAVAGLGDHVSAVTAGFRHGCAQMESGGMSCWGYAVGDAGDGSDDKVRLTPVPVDGLGNKLRAMAAGKDFTCALLVDARLSCWGENNSGQLGDGSTLRRSTPATVRGLPEDVTAVAAGYEHACAVLSGGRVFCWGRNASGQLGDGSTADRFLPGPVQGLAGKAKLIAAGSGHSCAVLETGAVQCWGGYPMDAGYGAWSGSLTPTPVFGLTGPVQAIVAGRMHTCALLGAGGVMCWGSNRIGELGGGSSGYGQLTALAVSGLASGVKGLAAGESHTCAVLDSGEMKCWGANYNGQLGDGSSANRPTPVAVAGLSDPIRAIAAGESHSCAIATSGALKCWGSNYWGQLGNGGPAGFNVSPALVATAPAPRVPVVEFYNTELKHYFVTANDAEARGIDAGAAGAGWVKTGESFRAFGIQATNTLPVCRFYGTPGVGPNSHFYTINRDECEAVRSDRGWTYEGLAFFAFPADANGDCPSYAQPLYRIYNGRWQENDSNHRYTTLSAIYLDMQALGWKGEGVVMCLPSQ